MPPTKKKSEAQKEMDKKRTIAKKESARIKDLLIQNHHQDALNAAEIFLDRNPNESIISCLQYAMKTEFADWDQEFVAQREALRKRFVVMLNGPTIDRGYLSSYFEDWTFLFYGLFEGKDILKINKNWWIHPEDEDDASIRLQGPVLFRQPSRAVKQKPTTISIGYMSSSFYNHALAHLFCGVPAGHNKDTCNIQGLYTWKHQRDDRPYDEMDIFLKDMIEKGCDKFHPIGQKSDRDMATYIQNLNLDVLVVLDGLMSNTRIDLLRYGLAKVHTTVLGYPCTTGIPSMDYFVVDESVCNEVTAPDKFSEHLAFMPVSCFVGSHALVHPHLSYVFRAKTERGEAFTMTAEFGIPSIFKTKKGIAACWAFLQERNLTGKSTIHGYKMYDGSFANYPKLGSKAVDGITLTARFHYDLPENVTIFASFNAAWKLDPELFQTWMKILERVPNSILWIRTGEPNNVIEPNLRRAAGQNFVNRLFFAPDLDVEAHVRRISVVDFALDSRKYNGHTTSLDIFWAGTVIVSCPGEDFHNRVTCTLIRSMALSCLCTPSLDEYEETAVNLALNPKCIEVLQDQLQHRKLRAVIYDTRQFATDMESLCRKMIQYQQQFPDDHNAWKNLYAEAEGEQLTNGFNDIDLEELKIMTENTPTPTPASSIAAPNSPPPRPPSACSAASSSSRQQGEQAGVYTLTKIFPFYTHPLPDYLDAEIVQIGQRAINVCWLQNTGIHVLERMEANFGSLYIGPIMAAQFVDWMHDHLSVGIPKFPKKMSQFHAFFANPKHFRHNSRVQFAYFSEMFDKNGRMIEPENPIPGLTMVNRKTAKCKCCECGAYDAASVLVSTLLQQHVPANHTWESYNSTGLCPTCGVPVDLFENRDEFDQHYRRHTAKAEANERYLENGNPQDVELEEEFVTFFVNLQGENVLERELARYNDEASSQFSNPISYHRGVWLYQQGQRLQTLIWIKEHFQNTIEWMKANTTCVAASGAVGYHFIKLFEANLFDPFCRRFQNLGNMDAARRKLVGQTMMKFEYKTSYEWMCLLFNVVGGVDGDGGLWTFRRKDKQEATTFCKICNYDMKGGCKNYHQYMAEDHILQPVEPDCSFCGLKFGKHLGQSMAEARQVHSNTHARVDGWKETYFDDQDDNQQTKHEYNIKFHN